MDNLTVTPGAGETIIADEITHTTFGTGKVQYVKLMDGTVDGNTVAAVGANGLAADVKAIVPGTAATNLGKAEDAAHTTGDTGVMVLAVRKDTAAALATTDGDYIPLIVDSTGRLHIAAGATENVIGLVGSSDIAVAVTCPIDNGNALDAGDVIFDKTEIAGAARTSGGMTILQSLTVVDGDDNTAAAMTIVFLKASCTFGTIDSAPSISDADAAAYFAGSVVIASTDWIDLGGCKVATKAGIGLAMAPTATSLYVAAFGAGTPTYSTGKLTMNFKFLRS